MIRKSIYSFIVLVLLHAFLVFLYPNLGMATNQWQDNMVKAQTFFYAERADTAMVGSSLSARILKDSVPCVNSVSFGGCSVEDGLKIILAKKEKPKCILVETNYFLRGGNPNLVNRVTKGLIPQIKKFFPSLREKNEPICLVSGFAIHAMGVNPQAAATFVDMDFLHRSVIARIKSDSLASKSLISRRLQSILPLFRQLRQQGSLFIFFEMPVNGQLTNLPSNCQTRKVVLSLFPKSVYAYMPTDTASYTTTDGEHLSYEDQQHYSHFFKEALQQFK
jgi:hypothetical protein